ncbi:MAG: GTP-binding protein [Thermoproteus sp. AZ2]|jgi:elongation factor 1-alpha|uniref:GTP-binding protein n=1 Tax=Thermoproteus sp. AZ2 TaxID=1609232 RepID=A0ACC6V125_9CREN|nr:MAG: GTP-binding protein [Thermoproteus sp. AZ2]
MFPPESEEGNIEYKLRVNELDLDHLAGQMRRRLLEGGGEAIYILGVTDDGKPLGLGEEELKRALSTLSAVAERIGASAYLLRTSEGIQGRVAEVLIRIRAGEDRPPPVVHVVAIGNVDAGKSTLIGVLVTGSLDDGRGRARAYAARYKHEVLTGRTSAVSTRLLGFRGYEVVNKELADPLDEASVYLNSDKAILFIDVGGHEGYLRTSLRGILGNGPDYAMLIVAANSGVQRMTKEHLGIAAAMGIPIFVVVTRIDLVPIDIVGKVVDEVQRLLKMPGVSKMPYNIRDESDVVVAARLMPQGRIAPIFLVSNVTGEGLGLFTKFLSLLPKRVSWSDSGDALMYISEIYSVRGVGLVIGGLLEGGTVRAGQRAYIGPLDDGGWEPVRIKSIHLNRVSVGYARPGQYITIAIDDVKGLRKGMVLASRPRPSARAVRAEVVVLRHPTVIKPGFTGVLHLKSIRSPATISRIDKGALMMGDVGVVELSLARPWYIPQGERFIFRNGPTRILGKVVEAY